jgi:serine/threonine-protein kinase
VKTCPLCSKEYPDNVKFCPVDGSTLRAKAAGADLVGQVVADRYHIIKKLGEGGMGAVYLGEHVKMGRKSAIKVMNPGMAHDPDAVSRFNREASNASRISHPNVCQIYDFGETTDGLIYLAMEFIEGQSLSDVIDREGALPAVRAASILKQSADALQAAHDLGIVHRDLKPDNIMITQARDGSDVVKVVDFGIAKAVAGDETGQKVTKTGLVVGTPEYMSPEQLSGDKLDGRSDIYSLGLVLYRMLTGVLPFQADTAQEVMIKRLTDEPTPLVDARPDIEFPPGTQAVLDRVLQRLVADRYQNAAEFGNDTMATVAGLETPGTRVDVAPHVGATELMSADQVRLATKHVAAKKAAPKKAAAEPAAPASAPAKRFPLIPLLGGVGGVAGLAAVAVLMMNRGPSQVLATGDSTRTGQAGGQTTPDTAKGATISNRRPLNPVPDGGKRPTPDGAKRESTVTNNPPPTNAVTAATIEDSVNAAVRADQGGQTTVARRLARWTFYRAEATNKQKSDAAELIASGYDNDVTQALEWYRNALQYASGNDRTRIQNAIRALEGNP